VNEAQNVSEVQQPVAMPQQEKLLPQTEVNGLVGAAKQKAREQGHQQGYQQALQELQSQNSGTQPVQPPASTVQSPMANSPDDVRRIAAEEFARQQQIYSENAMRQQQQANGQRIFNDLQTKFAVSQKDNPAIDFGKTLQDFESTPEILRFASTVDNSPEVLQYLRENPEKINSIRGLSDNFGNVAMKKISDSIRQNQTASSSQRLPEPLSQIRPSNLGVGNSDSASPSAAFKGQY
jgi:hypothetical protein